MKEELLGIYRELCSVCGISPDNGFVNLSVLLKDILGDFSDSCQRPAIWGNGEHTKRLMADFVFEIRKAKIIIDSNAIGDDESGYKIITSEQLLDNEIDGVIISSYKYRNEIVSELKKKFPNVKYLDIYAELLKYGIDCGGEYYLRNHPYEKYKKINELLYGDEANARHLQEAMCLSIEMKDFHFAKKLTDFYIEKYGSDDKIAKIQRLLDKTIVKINDAVKSINKENLLMLCIDSLRNEDLEHGLMPNLREYIKYKMQYCNRAYSVSTSTYESLIPAYSENFDLRSKYYENNKIAKDDCRFINRAIEQGRKIHFYADGETYVENEAIQYSRIPQTVTEKIWDFIIDSADEKNGLFYIHVLYESHFSFVNPYTKEGFYAGGTNLFFDFLEKNGGELKTDYIQQHKDALRYIDDTLNEVLWNLRIPMIIFADHGISIVSKESKIETLNPILLAYDDSKIRIPFAYWNGDDMPGESNELMSLADINGVIIDLLNGNRCEIKKKDYVKIQRSRIYNPDYIFLYNKLNFERGALAFEAFVFESGEKLVLYENGQCDLLNKDERFMQDEELKQKLLKRVLKEITVCPKEQLCISRK